MSDIAVRVREARIDLPYDGGAPGRLILDVPSDPMKADRGTVVFRWQLKAANDFSIAPAKSGLSLPDAPLSSPC